jgi:hypothetical protein
MCYPGLLQLGSTMFKTGHAPRNPAHAEARSDSGVRTLSLSVVGALVVTSMAGMAVVITLAFLRQWLWALATFIVIVGTIAIIVRNSLLSGKFTDQK